jgi:hypothetical protein
MILPDMCVCVCVFPSHIKNTMTLDQIRWVDYVSVIQIVLITFWCLGFENWIEDESAMIFGLWVDRLVFLMMPMMMKRVFELHGEKRFIIEREWYRFFWVWLVIWKTESTLIDGVLCCGYGGRRLFLSAHFH